MHKNISDKFRDKMVEVTNSNIKAREGTEEEVVVGQCRTRCSE